MKRDTTPCQNPAIAEIGDTLARLFRRGCGGLLVGISGRGGSGKSTLAVRLAARLRRRGIKAYVLHQDDFVFESIVRNADPDPAKGRYWHTYDFKTLYGEILAPLALRGSVDTKVLCLNRRLDRRVERRVRILAPTVVITEGIQLFRRSQPAVFDYRIWIDLAPHEGLERVVQRRRHLGLQVTRERARRMYLERSTPGFELYLKLDDPIRSCDLVLDGRQPLR